ncbi:MAG: hypothetical protein AAF063_02305 [Cyanobacteria bacterium J06643_5]
MRLLLNDKNTITERTSPGLSYHNFFAVIGLFSTRESEIFSLSYGIE